MTTPSSVPAQGEAPEVLRELIGCVDTYARLRQLHEMGHGTDHDATRRRFEEALDRARALVAASPCAAQIQPTYYVRHPDDSYSVAQPQPAAAAQGGQQPARGGRPMTLRECMEAEEGAAPAPAAPLTEDEIRAIADIGSAPLNRDGMLCRLARDIESACAAKWGITLAGTAQKGGEDGR